MCIIQVTGDLSNRESPLRVEMEIQRCRRKRRHIDRGAIQRRLEEALDKPVALTRIAKDLDSSQRFLRTLHPDLCREIGRKVKIVRLLRASARESDIVAQVTETLLALNSAGETLTLRNAGIRTGAPLFSGELRSILFGILRSELGAELLNRVPQHAMSAQLLSLGETSRERLRAVSR